MEREWLHVCRDTTHTVVVTAVIAQTWKLSCTHLSPFTTLQFPHLVIPYLKIPILSKDLQIRRNNNSITQYTNAEVHHFGFSLNVARMVHNETKVKLKVVFSLSHTYSARNVQFLCKHTGVLVSSLNCRLCFHFTSKRRFKRISCHKYH